MNILGYAPQMAAYGGMERHICDLSAVLAARGHHVTLLSTSNSLAADERARLLHAGVTLRELQRRRGEAGAMIKSLWLVRESLRDRRHWDLIYTNGQSGLARLPWLGARAGTRIVHHHHTSADAREQKTWSASFRRVLSRAPEIVACSRATREALAAALGRSDVRFLPYLTRSVVSREVVHDRVSSSATPLNFGFLGRLVAEKGIDLICELSRAPELSDILWHIHGEGPKYPPAFFQAFPRIVYHGAFRGGAQQAEILRKLDAVVLLSSHNEGMPLSLIEAMSAGLPWIASARGGTRELAVSAENSCVVEDLSPAALTAAVRSLAVRIRAGATSRIEQRRAYDHYFSPAIATAAWSEFIEAPKPQPV